MPLVVFPVAQDAHASFRNDFGEPRSGGRTHQGIDIFAPEGALILAPDAGALRFYEDPVGGHAFTLDAKDAHYYGAHLSAYVGDARKVDAGEPIGRVGRTGNAASTPPHLHFQMSVSGATINPYSYLVAAQSGSDVWMPVNAIEPVAAPCTGADRGLGTIVRALPWSGPAPASLGTWAERFVDLPLGTIIRATVEGVPVVARVECHYAYASGAPSKWHRGVTAYRPARLELPSGRLVPVTTPPAGWPGA